MNEKINLEVSDKPTKLTELLVSAIAGYVESSDAGVRKDLADLGYKEFIPESVRDSEVFEGKLKEATDETSKLPPIIKIGDVWFTRNPDIVEAVTKYYQDFEKEFLGSRGEK